MVNLFFAPVTSQPPRHVCEFRETSENGRLCGPPDISLEWCEVIPLSAIHSLELVLLVYVNVNLL